MAKKIKKTNKQTKNKNRKQNTDKRSRAVPYEQIAFPQKRINNVFKDGDHDQDKNWVECLLKQENTT